MHADNEIAGLSARSMLDSLRNGRVCAEDVARACLRRIESREPELRAWAHLDPSLVLANAREIDRAGDKGSLHGLPIGVKDVILTEDMPTQHNSALYRGSFPKLDAACVASLRAAGAIILGKTDTVEFAATGRKALTRNPHDLARTPGGSSSGSAAAVADFHAPLALGTQTGGSIIRPASFCGVFALKPTWGLVSTEGAKSFAPTLDTIGWFARTADDLRLLYDVFDPEPAPSSPDFDLSGSRIAICRSPMWDYAEPATRDALAAAEAALVKAGASVFPLDLPAPFDQLTHHHSVIMQGEGRGAFLAQERMHGERLHPNLRAYVGNAGGHTRQDLTAAYDIAARCRETFDAIAGEFDAVLTPSVVGEAPIGLAQTGSMIFNGMWTLLHVPCVNLPGFTGPAGLPVGLTVTGPRFSDRKVLSAAEAMAGAFAAAIKPT